MKIKDVVVGGTYLTRVGPDLVRVEVTGRNPVPGYSNRHDRFWVKNLRTNPVYLFVVSLIVSVGMWLERFVIIVTSLYRDFLPSSWGAYRGTMFDWAAFVGTIGLFLTLFFLFIRFLPAISISEMRTILPEAEFKEEEG